MRTSKSGASKIGHKRPFSVSGGSPGTRSSSSGERPRLCKSRKNMTLMTAFLPSPGLPNLIDVFDVIQLLSLVFPCYNIIARQCYWFARTIYDCLRHAYSPYREDVLGKKWWKRSKFMLVRLLTPSPPSLLLSFCRVKKVWSEDATVGQICGSPGGEGSSSSVSI